MHTDAQTCTDSPVSHREWCIFVKLVIRFKDGNFDILTLYKTDNLNFNDVFKINICIWEFKTLNKNILCLLKVKI